MTKTIIIPLSKETCHKIKIGIGLSLWILATVGMIYGFVASWFDTYNADGFSRIFVGFFTATGTFFSILFMSIYLHEEGFWINFECNCEVKKK